MARGIGRKYGEGSVCEIRRRGRGRGEGRWGRSGRGAKGPG